MARQRNASSLPAGSPSRQAARLATKQVATAGDLAEDLHHHIQRRYGKAGVSTRAGATLFAPEHGLVGPGETAGVDNGRPGAKAADDGRMSD